MPVSRRLLVVPFVALALAFVSFPLARYAFTAGPQKGSGSGAPLAAFTAGNVVVYRAGDGSAALGSGATAIFLDEYTPAGTLVQSIPMPTAVSGSNKRLTGAGSSTTEGLLTRSADGRYLTLGGYDAAPGTAAVAGTTSAATNRVVGRVDASGSVDTTTALTNAFSGGNIRSVVSSDGTTFWMDGSSDGVRTATLGATTSTVVSSTQTNLRQINIFNGQLYVSSGAGTNTTKGVNKVGTGLPTSTGNTTTRLAGFTDTAAPSTYAFVILDDPNNAVSGIDTIYVADDTTSGTEGGLQKWTSTDGVNWAKQYRGLSGTAAFRGVTGQYVGTTLSLFATTTDNKLVSVADTGSGFTFATLATAASNTAFRGVAFAPVAAAPTPTPSPSLNVNDVAQAEGNAGTTAFTFTVSLTSAAASNVTFNWNTADGTATAPSDYTAVSNGSGTITAGNTQTTITVNVNGDTTQEPNETFFVNITNVVGATAGDVQGQGTIQNDDVTLAPIYTIQGSGSTSPLVGQIVTTTGIVTGIKAGSSGGFFLQDPSGDGNPNTSDGVFVFTGSTLPAGAVVGNLVQVTGTVQEFVFSSDPNSPPITEISSVTAVVVNSTGNTLPAPHTLTAAETTAPSGTSNPLDSLEEFEGMRVTVPSLTVVAPTQGTITEPSATVSSTGVFYGVVAGVARPFREPGVNVSDPLPAGSPPRCPVGVPGPHCVPTFDENPERIRVDSDGQPGTTALDVTAGSTITNVTGPLDYQFRTYTILPDTTLTASNVGPVPAPAPSGNEFTVASFNMERFFDTANDPNTSDPVLTQAAFDKRVNKASLIIRNIQRYPDVIGVEEVENLSTLQAVAAKVNSDAQTIDGLNNPSYVAYLVEGNDIGGIDVGFLVKMQRVVVTDVTQIEQPGCDHVTPSTCNNYTNPNDGTLDILNDRPPLVLRATISRPGTLGTLPFTVIVNHLRSLSGIDDTTVQGTGTVGARIREKRKKQAEFLANYIQSRQTNDPSEKIISVGDYNAFNINDGYVDVMGTIKGTPSADDQTVVPGDGADLVNPDLVNLVDTLPADQRYSFSFDGNAQVLDQVLVNPNANAILNRFAYAREDADYPVKYYEDGNRPERISDHDQPIAYFTLVPVTQPGQLIISEFRLRGPSGANDEFVELYNNTNSDIMVSTTDGSSGYALVASDNALRFVVPNNTIIPARGHYLGCNSGAYSLSSYPAGDGSLDYPATTATCDATYTTDIPDNAGIALFNTSNGASWTVNNRLDAAGSSVEANTLYKEGAGYPALIPFSIDYSFFRNMTATGLPKDTQDNAADFVFADTAMTDAGAGARLGAPGPENLSSPVNRGTQIKASLIDPGCAGNAIAPTQACPRYRDATPSPNSLTSTFGTLSIRRRFTNNTGGNVTRLRFRVVDITTGPTPPANTGTADVRLITSNDQAAVCQGTGNGCSGVGANVTINGTTLEQPPTQANGGGYNSSASAGSITLATPLAPGGSINLQFLLGVKQTGNFRFFVVVEALPDPHTGPFSTASPVNFDGQKNAGRNAARPDSPKGAAGGKRAPGFDND